MKPTTRKYRIVQNYIDMSEEKLEILINQIDSLLTNGQLSFDYKAGLRSAQASARVLLNTKSQQSPVKTESVEEAAFSLVRSQYTNRDVKFKTGFEVGFSEGAEWQRSQPVPVTEGREWVTYEDNSDLIEKESDPLLLFDTGEVAYYTSKWPNAVITHFMVNSPKLPTH